MIQILVASKGIKTWN